MPLAPGRAMVAPEGSAHGLAQLRPGDRGAARAAGPRASANVSQMTPPDAGPGGPGSMMRYDLPAVPAGGRGAAGCVPRLPGDRPAAAGLPPGADARLLAAEPGRARADRGVCVGAERLPVLPRRARRDRAGVRDR